MIITFAGTPLNAGGRESPSGLRISVRRMVQVAPVLRSAAAKLFARGNRVWSISFSLAIEYANHGAAIAAIVEIEALLGEQGDLVLEAIGTGGAAQTITFENAVLESVEPGLLGRTTFYAYVFHASNRKDLTP